MITIPIESDSELNIGQKSIPSSVVESTGGVLTYPLDPVTQQLIKDLVYNYLKQNLKAGTGIVINFNNNTITIST